MVHENNSSSEGRIFWYDCYWEQIFFLACDRVQFFGSVIVSPVIRTWYSLRIRCSTRLQIKHCFVSLMRMLPVHYEVGSVDSAENLLQQKYRLWSLYSFNYVQIGNTCICNKCGLKLCYHSCGVKSAYSWEIEITKERAINVAEWKTVKIAFNFAAFFEDNFQFSLKRKVLDTNSV